MGSLQEYKNDKKNIIGKKAKNLLKEHIEKFQI